MSTRGQPVQIAPPPVLAPRDDGRAAAPTTPAAGAWPAFAWAGLKRWESSFALLLISTVYSSIQGATQDIIGIDGYYHIKVALLMRQQGWRLLAPLDFPWLQLTILGPGRYTDHHFLFHVFQAPFTLGDPRLGAKMAAVLFAVLGLYTTYHFLSRFGVRYPLLWIAAVLACAPVFLWRQSMARTQSLSLLLIVLGLWALFAGRPRLLLPVGFLAAWLFNGFFFVLGAPAGAVVVSLGSLVASRWWLRPSDDAPPPNPSLHERRGPSAPPDPRVVRGRGEAARRLWQQGTPSLSFAVSALAWTLLGLCLGLLLHPYFPRNVEFAFFHLLPKAVPVEQGNVSVGQEWYPYSLDGFILRVGPTAFLTVVGLLPLAFTLWRRQWPEWRSLVLAILAVGFLGMVAASQRIIEYFPAIAVIFCAWSLSHAVGPLASWLTPRAQRVPEHLRTAVGRFRRVAPALVGVILLPFIVNSTLIAARQAGEGLPWTTFRDGARWLAANTPAGSRVFTTGWDDFPHMFFWNTHNVYLVGLDPTYMSIEDPEGYAVWRSVTNGRVQRPSRIIRERFASPYVLTDMQHRRFLEVAAEDPGLEEVFRSKTVVVFRVRGE
ncbi:MAG: hypothetical protein AB7P40_01745 [Chloroflexota bacterium]